MDGVAIEQIEHKYLKEIAWYLTNEKGKIINLLRTKQVIKDDWIDKFDRIEKKTQIGEISRGSERVFASLFPNTWRPNSSPIGADFMFETVDSIIHIDIKTTRYANESDHRGKVPFGENQTSYQIGEIKGNLPTIYTLKHNVHEQKLCVTYIIQIVYVEDSDKILCVVLVCIPNGELRSEYGDNIMDKGKTKGKSFRYKYGNQTFKLLDGDHKRYTVLYFNDEQTRDRIITLVR